MISPTDGTITSWRVNGSVAGMGTIQLRVIRPAAGGLFTGAGTSALATALNGTTPNATNLPIQAGDGVGIELTAGPGAGEGRVEVFDSPGASFNQWFPTGLGDGATLSPTSTVNDSVLKFNATVELLAPVITGVAPASGSIAGGDVVTITGQHLATATAVTFGAVPAASIQSASNSQIVAIAPPQGVGTVDIQVSTAAGSNVQLPTGQYTYIVPDTTAPKTGIDRGPSKKTTRHRVKFRFSSNEEDATFECKLDRSLFKPCTSPKRVRVGLGKHLFKVEAVDPAGNVDSTPVAFRWRVVKR